MISAKSLRVDYDEVTAVLDLDVTIPAGQIYGLVGPNGAGKTSTIKALVGILEPTYGEIKIGGIDLELHPQEALLKLGYMPDFPPVYENLKVWEYLDVFATAYKIPKSERVKRVRQWVERVDLTSKFDAFIHTLSRGMRQRLVLAKTLIHEPSVLLLDEPASGMDPMARMDLRKILKEVADKGSTVLISSHILTELSDFCTAIGIMEKGRMVVSGTIEEIRARVGSKGRLTVRMADLGERSRDRLRDALRANEFVVDVLEKNIGEFRCYFRGNPTQAAKLLASLVHDGQLIADFHLDEDNVEDIFFKIGAKEVS